MKLLRSIKINLFFTLLIGILGFILNRIFASTMGSEALGLMRLFTQMLAYLNLADLGIAVASSYALYEPLSKKNYFKVNVVMNTLKKFYKKISWLILIIGILISLLLKFIIKDNIFGIWLYIYWAIYVINLSYNYSFARYSILFTADQKYSEIRKIQGISRVAINILQVFILIYTNSFLIFLLMIILENIILSIYYKGKFKKEYSYLINVEIQDSKIFKDMKNLFWHKLGTIVVFNTDLIILSTFTSLKEVGVYSTYLMVYKMIMTIVNIGGPAITPSIGKYITENSKKNIYLKWREFYFVYMLLGTLIVYVSYNLFQPFIKLWMGEDYILPNLTLVLILINLFIEITRQITEIFKRNSGFFDDVYIPALEAGINLIISLYLVKKMGINGVVIGTITSNILIILILKPILVFKRCFNKSGLEYIGALLSSMLLSTLACYVSKNLYTVKLIESWSQFIGEGIKLTVLTLTILCIVYTSKKEFKLLLLSLKKNNITT